ncbi:MAG: hypothetical protein QM754_13015 [Tepidisphaeraceae bacterium]
MPSIRRTALLALFALPAVVRADLNAALDTLYESGENLKTLAADVSLRTVGDESLGDDKTKVGRFVLQKLPDGDSRVRATFTKRISGNKVFAEKKDYLLAGTDLTERDYSLKKQTIRQIRQPGQKLNLFKLGEGPFPLPIGQKREDVLKEFDVKELKNDDPKVLAVVELTPKKETKLADKFDSITVAIDRETKLPGLITTVSPKAVETNEVRLTNVRTNGDVKDDEFKLEPIDEATWKLISTK